MRHSYATAALKAGIPPKVISERLGHATAAFTLQTYTHVIPGMDESAAATVAALILAKESTADADGRTSGRMEDENVLKKQPAWAKAQASDGSGGSVRLRHIVGRLASPGVPLPPYGVSAGVTGSSQSGRVGRGGEVCRGGRAAA